MTNTPRNAVFRTQVFRAREGYEGVEAISQYNSGVRNTVAETDRRELASVVESTTLVVEANEAEGSGVVEEVEERQEANDAPKAI